MVLCEGRRLPQADGNERRGRPRTELERELDLLSHEQVFGVEKGLQRSTQVLRRCCEPKQLEAFWTKATRRGASPAQGPRSQLRSGWLGQPGSALMRQSFQLFYFEEVFEVLCQLLVWHDRSYRLA
jgi:hypothetical protein